MKGEDFDQLIDEAIAHYNKQEKCYVFDGFVGAAPESRRKVNDHNHPPCIDTSSLYISPRIDYHK